MPIPASTATDAASPAASAIAGEAGHTRPDGAVAGYEFDGASFTVDGRELLAPLSLSLGRGLVHGLIGHNGSGKSTLLKLMARQQHVSGGAIRFEGRALAEWSSRDFARKVAYLPQTTASGHGLTVRELVGFGRYPWHGPFGRWAARDADAVAAALTLCGVDAMAERLVDTLSGGERQRAWIAMLVAQEADYILLDEPISALDLAQQVEVLGFVRELSRRRGIGVVAVLHDINMAARFCDEIVALRAGRVRFRGTPAELLRPPVLEDIYAVPMAVLANPSGGPSFGYPR